jgi:hypothetical protein
MYEYGLIRRFDVEEEDATSWEVGRIIEDTVADGPGGAEGKGDGERAT